MAISVSDFQKNYGATVAVEQLSFEVPAGMILGLLGPNGAGKTTTLRALVGIIPPTRGTLRVDGHDVGREPVEAKRRIAFVPDDPHLFDSLTVWEHLEFIAATYRVADFEPSGVRLLETFQLTEKRDTVARELSRGMRQKVAICCAYLHEPSVILMDEPMTGLDPRGIRTLKDSVFQQAERGAAIVISSHLLSFIEDLCSHLLILHRGRGFYFRTLAEAATRFPDLKDGSSLEDVFFRATET